MAKARDLYTEALDVLENLEILLDHEEPATKEASTLLTEYIDNMERKIGVAITGLYRTLIELEDSFKDKEEPRKILEQVWRDIDLAKYKLKELKK